MNPYYTNVEIVGSNVLVREIDSEGVRRRFKTQWRPTLYMRDSNQDQPSEFKSLYDDAVKSIQPGTIQECRDFVRQYDSVDGVEIFGQTNYALNYMNEVYPWDIDFQASSIGIWSIDIETRIGEGFPEPKTADCEIVLITMQNVNTKVCYTFGTKPYSGDDTRYALAKDEYSLLKMFLQFWNHVEPDIVTGWNIETFDIPYIANRISRVLGEGEESKLSPWGYVSVKSLFVKGNEEVQAEIKGVSILDYLALYKKFTYTKRESYSLQFIAQEELGHSKVELPGKNFNDNIDGNLIVTEITESSSDLEKKAYRLHLIKEEMKRRGLEEHIRNATLRN